MNKCKSKLFSILLVTVLPIVALADGKGQTKYKKISPEKMSDAILKMSDKEVGELLLSKSSMLGGECNVQTNLAGSVLHTLKVPGMEHKRIGEAKPSGATYSYKKTKIFGFTIWKQKIKTLTYSPRTSDEQNIGKKDLGAAFKTAIVGRDWPCGTISAESSSIPLHNLRQEVQFYRDEETKETICISPNGKLSNIRKPGSCEYEPVMQELDKSVCKYLVHLARKDAEGQLYAATRNKASPNKSNLNFPRFLPLTAEVRRKIDLGRFLLKNPDIHSFMAAGELPVADSFLSKHALEYLEKDNDIKDFNELPQDMQHELVRISMSVNAVEGDSEFVQPSQDLINISKRVEGFATSFLAKNPNFQIDLYHFPKVSEVHAPLELRMAPLVKIMGAPFRFDMSCAALERRKIFRPAPWASSFKVDFANWEHLNSSTTSNLRVPASLAP